MKSFAMLVLSCLLFASIVHAAPLDTFTVCPVESVSVKDSFGQYIVNTYPAPNPDKKYWLSRNTTATITGIVFLGDTTFVRAPQAGTVVYVVTYDYSGSGYFIGVKHVGPNGTYFTQYSHVDQSLVAIGDVVYAGQPVATLTKSPCGNTFTFSMTTNYLNSATSLPATGYKAFPSNLIDPFPYLQAVCK